jgi:ferric-dicitrate binding protein FerR (iron transport regulator)
MKKLVAALCIINAALLLFAEDAALVYLEGEVSVTRQGIVIQADFGTELEVGDLVQTGPDSVAVITTARGDDLKMRAETSLEIEEIAAASRLRLNSGGLFARVKRLAGRAFSVSTPSVAAGVRGTEFFIAYGRTIEAEPDVWLCVNEGSVSVSTDTGEEVVVNEGEGVNILAGARITDPRFFPWTLDLNWNTDPAAGEIRDVTDLDGAYADLKDIDYD